MSAAPDYRNYSLEELQDALWSIDRLKFPARYDLLKAEIERKEALQDYDPTFVQQQAQQRRRVLANLKIFNWLQYGAMFCFGVVYPLWFQVTARPQTDMPFHLLFVPFTFLVLMAGAYGVWAMRRALKNNVPPEVAHYWSLYALALAPHSSFFFTLAGIAILQIVPPLLLIPIGYALPFFLLTHKATSNKS